MFKVGDVVITKPGALLVDHIKNKSLVVKAREMRSLKKGTYWLYFNDFSSGYNSECYMFDKELSKLDHEIMDIETMGYKE